MILVRAPKAASANWRLSLLVILISWRYKTVTIITVL